MSARSFSNPFNTAQDSIGRLAARQLVGSSFGDAAAPKPGYLDATSLPEIFQDTSPSLEARRTEHTLETYQAVSEAAMRQATTQATLSSLVAR